MRSVLSSFVLVGLMGLSAMGQEQGNSRTRGGNELQTAAQKARQAAYEAQYWAFQASQYAPSDPQAIGRQWAVQESAHRRARREAYRWMGQQPGRPTVAVQSVTPWVLNPFSHPYQVDHSFYFTSRGYRSVAIVPSYRVPRSWYYLD